MRVLLVSSLNNKAVGGISSWTKAFIEYCNDSGLDCDIVNTSIVGKRMTNESTFNLFDEFSRFNKIIRSFRKAIKTKKYEIVHINSSCSCLGLIRDYFIANKAKKSGVNVVVHFHCDIPYQVSLWKRSMSKLGYHYLSKLMRLSPNVIVLCENSKKFLLDKFKIVADVIPNFINREHVLKEDKQINSKIEKVCFVGHVIPEKGCDELFDLAKLIPRCKFIIVGEVSDRYKALIQDLTNVYALGIISSSDVLRELDFSDVFILPTYSEGFSMALLEAMARGVPCITTDVGANRDMIEDMGGVIVQPKSVEALFNAFMSISDFIIRQNQSKWNVKKVSTCYVSERVFEKYISFYNKIICTI